MIQLIPRYLLALLCTVGAYMAYAKFAAPRIEGPATLTKVIAPSPVTYRPAGIVKQELVGLLPENGWEWEPCTILETRQAKLLFQDYKVQDDGSIELFPLTMVLNSPTGQNDTNPSESSKKVPPLVMRAPEGARLKFENGLTAGGELGDLEQGQLRGAVTLYRQESEPGANDSLVMETQNVQISPERIFTLYECRFRFGNSIGHGKHLTIDMFGPAAEPPVDSKIFAGVQRIELSRLYELYLHREKGTRLYAPQAGQP